MNLKKHQSGTRNYIKKTKDRARAWSYGSKNIPKAPSVVLINVFNKLVRDIITVVSN